MSPQTPAPSIDADHGLTERLIEAAPSAHRGPVVSVDLFYDDRDIQSLPGAGVALGVEMEAATLFAIGARTGVSVGCLLTISDTFDQRGARERIDDDALVLAAEAMGEAAVSALRIG